MKLVLNDNTEIDIVDFTSSAFLFQCTTFLEAVNLYNTVTGNNNLSNVKVINGEIITFAATDLTSDGIQITPNNNGYSTIIYYHGAKATSADDEYVTVGRILMGEEE